LKKVATAGGTGGAVATSQEQLDSFQGRGSLVNPIFYCPTQEPLTPLVPNSGCTQVRL